MKKSNINRIIFQDRSTIFDSMSKLFTNQLWREFNVICYPLNNVSVRYKRDPLNRASPLFTCYRTAIICERCVSQRFDTLLGFFARANRDRGKKRRRERGIGRRRIFWAWRYRFIGGKAGDTGPLSRICPRLNICPPSRTNRCAVPTRTFYRTIRSCLTLTDQL